MSAPRRALSEAFVDAMRRRDAWPDYKWLRERRGLRFKNDAYSGLKRGEAVPEKMIVSLVRTLLRAQEGAFELRCRQAIVDFLAQRGLDNPESADDERLLELLCVPGGSTPARPSTRQDFLQRGFDGVIEFMQAQVTRHLTAKVQACRDERDVRTAVRWMYVAAARYAHQQPGLEEEQAIRSAESLIGLSPDDYAHRACAWWRSEPWTVVWVRGAPRPVGMSVVLPLSAELYRRLLDGTLPSHACAAGDLASPSPCILIEAAAERPTEHGSGPTRISRAMYYVVMAQVAALARPGRLPHHEPLRMLSFAASPLARRRLIAYGYKPTRRRMLGTDVEFYERVLERRFDAGLVPRAVLDTLGTMLPAAPPP